jgi:hypothetical protein
MATIVDRQVGASYDDVLRIPSEANGWYATHTQMGAGYVSSGQPDWGSGLRFTSITIPKGATITAAYLTITAKDSFSATTVKSYISAEAADNPATFANDKAAFDTRFGTHGDRIAWDNIAAWTADTEYQSVGIKDVIQAIVNRAGWSSGNAIVIFWEDFDKRSTQSGTTVRTGYTYDASTAKAVKLHIEYSVPQTISPSSISQLVAYGTPTVLTSALIIQPSSIVQVVATGTPALRYLQTISPPSIIVTIAYGTPSVGTFGIIVPQSIIQQISIGSPTILKYVWHVILDGQYATETPEKNRMFVIGRDQYGNPVYGEAHDTAESGLVGERLDFTQELAIPTTAQAGDVASAILAKMRLHGKGGIILIPPNCGQELFDVVQISDAGANQSAVKFRVVGLRFEYNVREARYQHRLILGAP